MPEQDLRPLFLFKKSNEDEMRQAGAVITAGGEAYKASSFITNIAEAIKDEVAQLVTGTEMGEITVAAYVLMEALHETGMVKTVNGLLADPAQLFQAAMFTAIGMRAGMILPEDTQFETTTSDSDLSLRDITEIEDSESK